MSTVSTPERRRLVVLADEAEKTGRTYKAARLCLNAAPLYADVGFEGTAEQLRTRAGRLETEAVERDRSISRTLEALRKLHGSLWFPIQDAKALEMADTVAELEAVRVRVGDKMACVEDMQANLRDTGGVNFPGE